MKTNVLQLTLGFALTLALASGVSAQMAAVHRRAEDVVKVYLQNYEENEDGLLGEQLGECTIRRHQYRNLRNTFLSPAGQRWLEPMVYPGTEPTGTAWYALVGEDKANAKQFFTRQCSLNTVGYY